jgi:integrase
MLFAKLRRPDTRPERRTKALTEKTIKNIRATLAKVFAKAVEWGVLPVAPRLPKVKAPDPKWDFLSPAESTQLLAAERDPEKRTLLLFALRTGARAGEQLALEWGDIDFANKQVVLRRSMALGQVVPTKSGKERRVPLTDELVAALKRHRHLRSNLVFCRVDGVPLTLRQLRATLTSACKAAGLRRVRWHDIRHSFGSQLSIAGVPLRQVQVWLGHSSIVTTQRYVHLAPGGGRKLIGALDTAAGRANQVQMDPATKHQVAKT